MLNDDDDKILFSYEALRASNPRVLRNNNNLRSSIHTNTSRGNSNIISPLSSKYSSNIKIFSNNLNGIKRKRLFSEVNMPSKFNNEGNNNFNINKTNKAINSLKVDIHSNLGNGKIDIREISTQIETKKNNIVINKDDKNIVNNKENNFGLLDISDNLNLIFDNKILKTEISQEVSNANNITNKETYIKSNNNNNNISNYSSLSKYPFTSKSTNSTIKNTKINNFHDINNKHNYFYNLNNLNQLNNINDMHPINNFNTDMLKLEEDHSPILKRISNIPNQEIQISEINDDFYVNLIDCNSKNEVVVLLKNNNIAFLTKLREEILILESSDIITESIFMQKCCKVNYEITTIKFNPFDYKMLLVGLSTGNIIVLYRLDVNIYDDKRNHYSWKPRKHNGANSSKNNNNSNNRNIKKINGTMNKNCRYNIIALRKSMLDSRAFGFHSCCKESNDIENFPFIKEVNFDYIINSSNIDDINKDIEELDEYGAMSDDLPESNFVIDYDDISEVSSDNSDKSESVVEANRNNCDNSIHSNNNINSDNSNDSSIININNINEELNFINNLNNSNNTLNNINPDISNAIIKDNNSLLDKLRNIPLIKKEYDYFTLSKQIGFRNASIKIRKFEDIDYEDSDKFDKFNEKQYYEDSVSDQNEVITKSYYSYNYFTYVPIFEVNNQKRLKYHNNRSKRIHSIEFSKKDYFYYGGIEDNILNEVDLSSFYDRLQSNNDRNRAEKHYFDNCSMHEKLKYNDDLVTSTDDNLFEIRFDKFKLNGIIKCVYGEGKEIDEEYMKNNDEEYNKISSNTNEISVKKNVDDNVELYKLKLVNLFLEDEIKAKQSNDINDDNNAIEMKDINIDYKINKHNFILKHNYNIRINDLKANADIKQINRNNIANINDNNGNNNFNMICGIKFNQSTNKLAVGTSEKALFIFNTKIEKNKLFDCNSHDSREDNNSNSDKLQFIKLFLNYHKTAIKAIDWGSDGFSNLLVSGGGSNDKTIKIWSIGKESKLIIEQMCDTQICNVVFSKIPNCNSLISTHGFSLNEINIWSVDLKKEKLNVLKTINNVHFKRILGCCLNPYKNKFNEVITCCSNGKVCFWKFWDDDKIKRNKKLLGLSSMFENDSDDNMI